MMIDDTSISLLRQAVEQKAGRKIQTPKDFDFLCTSIFDECHVMVSVSTLKRIWGYVQSGSNPRPSSLTPLAQYIGYADWNDFVEKTQSVEAPKPLKNIRRPWIVTTVIAIVATVAIIVGLLLFCQSPKTASKPTQAPSGKRVLHKGEDFFRTIEDYLPLFGVEPGDTAYFRPVPGLDHVFVWGPEYGHPVWHNEGDSTQLMPTITEYWTPLPGTAEYQTDEYIRLANQKLYYERMSIDEIRITFMRDIIPSSYVFIGIYRMDRDLSTPEKFVWRRVSDSLDLGYLDQLELLREQG